MAENLNANTGLPEKPETIKINLPKSKNSYFPGADIQGEFETLGKYDTGLVHGMSQNDLRAKNQPNWKALGNSFVQLATGIVGDVVASPGYAYEGAGAITGNSDEFDNWFIQAGEYLKGLGTDYFPIYTDEKSQGVFRPFDGEWVANSIAQFGPTVAMIAATFLTEGYMYPALAARLSKLGQAGKWIAAAEGFIQSEAKLGRTLKAARMAGTSRLIEGGMEAYESFNSNYAQLIREGMSDEEARQMAGDAAAKVWTNNWMLAAVDMFQFTGILNGLGTIGKFGALKKPSIGLAYEMASEAAEEGFQFAVSKEAENEVRQRTGKIDYDTNILDEIIGNLGDPEMQKAMVQGALGGGVFTAAGKLANKLFNNSKENTINAQNAFAKNDKRGVAEARYAELTDYIKRNDAEGKLNSVRAQFQDVINKPDVNPEIKKVAESALRLIDFYEASRDSIEDSDPGSKAIKLDNLLKQKFNEELFAESEQALSQLLTDPQSQIKAVEAKLEELDKQEDSKNKQELVKKYEKELEPLKKANPEKIEPSSKDAQLKKEAAQSLVNELNLANAKEEARKLNTKKGLEEAKKQKEEAKRQDRLEEIIHQADNIQGVGNANLQMEAYKNDPDALEIIKKAIEKKAEEEIKADPMPDFSNMSESEINDAIYEYYKNKPFASKHIYNANNPQELKTIFNVKDVQQKDKFPTDEQIEKTPTTKGETKPAKLPDAEIQKTPKRIIKEQVEDKKKAEETIIEQPTSQEEIVTTHDDTPNPEMHKEYEDTEDTSNPEWAKSFDKALIKFKREKVGKGKDQKWVVGVRITNHKIGEDFKDNFVPLDVEEIEPDVFKVKTQPEGYIVPTKMRIGEYYTLKDSAGYPIDSNYIQFFKDYDVNVLRNLHEYKDESVYIEIDTNDGFNSDKDFDQIRMDVVIYPKGQRKVIGVLSAFNNNHGDSNALWESLRKDIYNEYQKEKFLPQPQGIFQYSLNTTIKKINGGRYNTISDKSKRSTPKAVIPSGMPLIFGVGYTIPGHNVATIQTNLEKDNANQDIVEYTADKPVKKSGLTSGGIYAFTMNAAGELLSARVFTKTIKQLPHLKNILLKEINKFRASEAIKIVKFRYKDNNGNLKTVPDFNDKMGSIYDKVQVGLNEQGKLEFYRIYLGKDNKITKKEPQKDSNGQLYNKRGFEQGAIVIDRSNGSIYRLENQVEGKWQVQQLDKDFNPIGEVQSRQFLIEAIRNETLYLHYAYNYYRFYDMDNRPAQIDHNLINTGNYNDIVNERLESDLVPQENFHSAKFSLDLNSLVKPKETIANKPDWLLSEIDRQSNALLQEEVTVEEIKQLNNKDLTAQQIAAELVKTHPNLKKFKLDEETPKGFKSVEYSVRAVRSKYNMPSLDDKRETIKNQGQAATEDVEPAQEIEEKLQELLISKPVKVKTEPQYLKVEQFQIRKEGDKYYFKNGEEVTDQTTINKYEVKANYNPKRVATYNNAKYYVLPDNRIISLAPSSKGKERFTSGTARNKILAQLSEPVEIKQPTIVEEVAVKPTQSVNKPEEVAEEKEERMSLSDMRKRRNRKPPKFMGVNLGVTRKLWNKEEELNWLKSKLSNIPNFVYDRLSWLKRWGVNGYGTFYNSAIHLIENAQEGTTYHEAFHASFNLFLTEKEQQKLLKDASRKYEVTEREINDMTNMIEKSSGVTLTREQAVNEVLEDKMADDFMKYVLAKQAKIKEINNLPFFKKLGVRITQFFNELFETASILLGNKNTIDKFFYNIQRGEYKNKQFVRNVDSVIPKFRKHPNYPNPGEYQNVIDVATSLLRDSIEEHKKLNPELITKQLVIENLLPPKSNNIEDYGNNLLFSPELPHSLYNKLLDRIDQLDEQGLLTDQIQDEFDRFVSSFMTMSPDGSQIRPKLLAFDILRNLSNSGIIINIDTSSFIEEGEIGQPEFEQDYDELQENTDFRDSWQLLTFSISPLERLGAKLRFMLNNIPVVDWTDENANEVYEVEGYLGFTKRYTIGHVYNQLIQKIGNSFNKQNMIDKFAKASVETPLLKKTYEMYGKDEEFLGNLWVHIGQKNHPKFVTTLQDKTGDVVRTKVIPTNSLGQTTKITEDIISELYATSPIYNKDGSINQEAAIALRDKFNEFKQKANEFAGSMAYAVFPKEYMEVLSELFIAAGINVSLEKLTSVNARKLKSFTSAITGKAPSFYSYFDLAAEGKDPIEEGNSGIRDFVKTIKSAYEYDIQDAHKNPTGGQVHEWIDGNFEGRLINLLKDKDAALQFIETMQQDEYYKYSPMLNLLKNSYTGNKEGSMYYINPEKLSYVVFSDTKLQGDITATEYKDMSDRQLYITILASYFNSNHFDGTAYLPLPVPSDSSSLSGVQIPVIQNVDYSELDGKKGILNYLYDIAYQEYIRVKLDRDTTKSQKKVPRDKEGKQEFIYFNSIELDQKAKTELLRADNTTQEGQAAIRAILEKAVMKLYKDSLVEEVRKLRDLNIIEKFEGKWKWKDNLMNNKPVEPFIEHFVGNWILFQHQFQTIFNGDISYYKNIGDFFKRAKQTWSPGTYLDTDIVRPTFNVKILTTNFIKPTDSESSYKEIEEALNKLFPEDSSLVKSILKNFEEIDETDGQSYIDLYRYKEQQQGLHRWDDYKEAAYRRLLSGQFELQDYDAVFNPNKPFYFGMHLVDNEIIPTQNKNSEFVILPAYANPNNPFYNPKYREMMEDMGYTFNEDGTVLFDETGRDSGKYTDQFTFDSTIKVGLFGQGDISTALTHKFNNGDWRLQMETPVHHINDDVIMATQVRKHMINNLDKDETYILSSPVEVKIGEEKREVKQLSGDGILKLYNDTIIKDINEAYSKVIKKFKNFNDLINTLREEVIKRDLGDQYLQALDTYEEQTEDGVITKTKLPLWHPLHLYRVESMLNSIIKNNVTKQKLESGVTLINVSSYGFKTKPRIKFKADGSLDCLEAYVPVYDTKLYEYADENGVIDVELVEQKLGKKALRGLVWRIPNEDKYSTFSIRIIGFLPKESGGAIVLPPEFTKIAGADFDIDKVYGFFYSLNPDGTAINKSSLDYKPGRDNLKLDMMRAIMESKSSTRSFLQPGGFETLKDNNKVINDAKMSKGQRNLKIDDDEYIPNINPITPSSWVDTSSQMMTGKALIGVSANANVAHAIFQHASELRLVQGFEFDGNIYSDFTGTKVANTNKLRTKNISETLAAFVDNGKNPQAKYSNINKYTIDIAMAMSLAGVNLDTVQFFLSQPIIEAFVQDYLNLGGNTRAERMAKQKYSEALGIKNNLNFNLKTLKVSSFTTGDLKANLTEYGDTTRQTQLLETFFSYKRLARPVSNLITAIKVGESGLGPSDSDNLYRLDLLNEDNFEGLFGAKELLNRSDLFPHHLIEVIRKGRELIVGEFDEDGNRTEQLRLPDRNRGAFAILRSMFRDYKPFSNLTVSDIEFVNKNYLDYLASATDFFAFDPQLIQTLPDRLTKAKKLGKYSNFLNRLNLDVDKANNITYIVYTGISGQDKHIIDRIRDSWEAMFTDGTVVDDNYTMSDLAYDLVKYSYMVSGFRITPQSFSHLQPANFYFDYLRPFNNVMEKIIMAVEQVDAVDSVSDQFYRSAVVNFYHQFIRNHFRSLTFIPAADMENKSNIRSYKVEKDRVNWVTVGNESIDMLDKGGNFVDYIKATYKYNTQLLKLKEIVPESANKSYAIYEPVEPLGTYKKRDRAGLTSGKMFTQYDFNSTLPDFKFKQNNIPESGVKKNDSTKDSGLTEDNPLNDKCNTNGM